jgi:ParB-like chromosome segregation protein Spo0J
VIFFYGLSVDFALLTSWEGVNFYMKLLDFLIPIIYIIENNPERRFAMAENANGTKEPPNEKNYEAQEIPEVEESQASPESPNEGSALVGNDKNNPHTFTPMTRKDLQKFLEKTEMKTETEITIKEIDINLLKPHPRNATIYGNEDVSELVALIKEAGKIIVPLVINKESVIISGHRRWIAAKELGFETVPCEVKNYSSDEDELQELIFYNQTREKTAEQKIRESMTLEEVYASEAYKRKIANLKQNQSVMDNLAKSDEAGATRDKVAQKAGLSSGRTYERGKTVIEKIDELKKDGKNEDAELLVDRLNKSVSGAEVLATKIDSLSEDDKRNLRSGKVRLGAIVPKTNNEDVITKPPSEYILFMEQLEKIEDAITALNNLSTLGESDKKKQKIQAKIENQIGSLQKLLETSSSDELKDESEV